MRIHVATAALTALVLAACDSGGSAVETRERADQPWMEWMGDQNRPGCKLNLAGLPAGADRLLVVVYVFSAAGPLSELRSLRLSIDEKIETQVNLAENGESAIIVGEFYSRNQQWKFRALAEGSAYGLSALGRRLGLAIDDAHRIGARRLPVPIVHQRVQPAPDLP